MGFPHKKSQCQSDVSSLKLTFPADVAKRSRLTLHRANIPTVNLEPVSQTLLPQLKCVEIMCNTYTSPFMIAEVDVSTAITSFSHKLKPNPDPHGFLVL